MARHRWRHARDRHGRRRLRRQEHHQQRQRPGQLGGDCDRWRDGRGQELQARGHSRGGTGRTLYLFEKDQGTASSCYGACAGGWPPDTTNGAPRAGAGVSASLLGTTTRTDGKTEVTYHGHPLYYFAGDRKPGDTNGEGIKAFGAEWYVLSAAGNKVEQERS